MPTKRSVQKPKSRAWIIATVLALVSLAGLLITYASFAASLDFSTLEGFFSLFAVSAVYGEIILVFLILTIFFTIVAIGLKVRG